MLRRSLSNMSRMAPIGCAARTVAPTASDATNMPPTTALDDNKLSSESDCCSISFVVDDDEIVVVVEGGNGFDEFAIVNAINLPLIVSLN